MNKLYLIAVIAILTYPTTILGQIQTLKFNPELNKTYSYEAQILFNTDKNDDHQIGQVQMMMKVDYNITFINEDLDFYLVIEGVKGFLKPSLIRTSSSPSKTRYFNTYDSSDTVKQQLNFKRIFIGKKILISSKKGIAFEDGTNESDLESFLQEGIIQQLVKFFQQKDSKLMTKIALQKGSSFEVIDSVIVKSGQNLKMTNRYLVKDFNNNDIDLTSIGHSKLKRKDIILAQRITLNKSTGMPKLMHQFMQLGSENEMFSQIEMRDIEAPNILEEYEHLNEIRLHNLINEDRRKHDIGSFTPLDQSPFVRYTTEEHSQKVMQYLDSLVFVKDELNRPMLVYSAYFYKQPLLGAYVEVDSLKMISKMGDTLSQIKKLHSKSHFSLSMIGPFSLDLFQEGPEIESISMRATVFAATETEKITLTSKRGSKGDFRMALSDSTISLTYQHDGLRFFSPHPMHSMKCYDKNGDLVETRLIGIEQNGLQKFGRYTALELAEIFANQDLSSPPNTISFVFKSKNVDKVVLEVYANEKQFSRFLTKP